MSETDPETVQNDQKTIEPEGVMLAPGETVRPLAFIRRKREYKIFIKLIKAGKVATAVSTARTLGVAYNTVRDWLKTPKAIQAAQENIDIYVQTIERSKDWKAAAYLLDKITGDSEKTPTGSTQNITIINRDGEYKIGIKG